jgi:hypothetical protein
VAVAAAAAVALATPDRAATVEAMLAAIVAADAAAMEANEVVNLGVIDHARYERLAQARDEAIDRAAAYLNR